MFSGTSDVMMMMHPLSSSTRRGRENDLATQHQSEVDRLMAELQARDQELNEMSASHSQQLKAWTSDKQRLARLEEDVSRQRAETNALRRANDELHQTLQTLSSRLEQSERNEQTMRNDLHTADASREKCAQRAEQLQRDLSVAQEELRSLSTTNSDLREQCRAAKSLESDLRSDIDHCSRQVAYEKSERESLRGQVDALQQSHNALETRNHTLSHDVKDARDRAQRAETEVSQARNTITSLQGTNNDYRRKLEQILGTVQQAKADIASYQQDVSLLTRELSVVKERESRKDRLLELAKSKEDRLETEMRNLRQALAQSQATLQILSQEVSVLNDQLGTTRSVPQYDNLNVYTHMQQRQHMHTHTQSQRSQHLQPNNYYSNNNSNNNGNETSNSAHRGGLGDYNTSHSQRPQQQGVGFRDMGHHNDGGDGVVGARHHTDSLTSSSSSTTQPPSDHGHDKRLTQRADNEYNEYNNSNSNSNSNISDAHDNNNYNNNYGYSHSTGNGRNDYGEGHSGHQQLNQYQLLLNENSNTTPSRSYTSSHSQDEVRSDGNGNGNGNVEAVRGNETLPNDLLYSATSSTTSTANTTMVEAVLEATSTLLHKTRQKLHNGEDVQQTYMDNDDDDDTGNGDINVVDDDSVEGHLRDLRQQFENASSWQRQLYSQPSTPTRANTTTTTPLTTTTGPQATGDPMSPTAKADMLIQKLKATLGSLPDMTPGSNDD